MNQSTILGRRRWHLLSVIIGALCFLTFACSQIREASTDRARAAGIADSFHRLYYERSRQTWLNTRWLGVEIEKCPLDLQVFQEIIWETRPDVIVEAGTFKGGSALFFASVLDQIGKGRVISIDIERRPDLPQHKRVAYLVGSSTDPRVLAAVRSSLQPGDRVMVDLDSDHHMAHVLEELRLYAPLVTPGGYLVVEDTNVNGHPVEPRFGPGPAEALAEFLRQDHRFVMDRSREKFLVTFNPGGYLRRTR